MLASCISPRADTDQDNVAEAVEALKTLQRTLHLLTPRDQSDVKRKLPFATSEWLEGLALSIRAQAESADGKNVDSMHAGNAVARLLEKETADAARIRLTPDTGKIVIVLVGLPARGKSMLCHKMEHFLTWRGYLTKSFRVGQMRRAAAAGQEYSGASFFDSSKAFATATREELTQNAFDELISWLTGDGAQIAIFDASNVTIQRRAKLQEKASKAKFGMIFIETICTDEAVIEREMLWKVKHSADFADMDQASAMKDLQLRIANYEKIYQYVREEEGPYIKLFDLRAKARCSNIYGRMANKVLPFLLAVHGIPRPVFLLMLPSGDEADASQKAREAAIRWAESYERKAELRILCSIEPRATATAGAIADAIGGHRPEKRPTLAPLVFESRDSKASSFTKKFGESVTDLVARLEPIILEIEGATEPLIIIAAEASCRTLCAYLKKEPLAEISSRDDIDASISSAPSDKPQLIQFTFDEGGAPLEVCQDLLS